jgi:hypothetical protein
MPAERNADECLPKRKVRWLGYFFLVLHVVAIVNAALFTIAA